MPAPTSKPSQSSKTAATRALTHLVLQRQTLDQEREMLDLLLSTPATCDDGAENGEGEMYGYSFLDDGSGKNEGDEAKMGESEGGEVKGKVRAREERGRGKVLAQGEDKMVKEMRDRKQEIELEVAVLEVESELVFLGELIRGKGAMEGEWKGTRQW